MRSVFWLQELGGCCWHFGGQNRNDKYPAFASTWMELDGIMLSEISQLAVSYTHLTLPTSDLV